MADVATSETTRPATTGPEGSIFDPVDVDLKNPRMAAVLAWLWPGAGHIYQRRYGKALLFMLCILVTYSWGFAMGGGHVVYASWRKPDVRYPYLFQLGVGLPALPALVQSLTAGSGAPVFGDFMAPPTGPKKEQQHDHLASWHDQLGFYFELGTLYTMIAGMLNVLAIYDAYAGPVFTDPRGRTGPPPPEEPDADKS